MPFPLLSFCSYLSRTGKTWHRDDYAANNFIHALKGRPFRGTSRIPIPGGWTELRYDQREEAFSLFGLWAAVHLGERFPHADITLIPLPNSSCCVGDTNDGAAFRMAMATRERLARRQEPGRVQDLLRWQARQPPSHIQPGIRSPEDYYPNLAVSEFAEAPSGVVVLVDDVVTSGSHMQAAAAVLRRAGVVVTIALCAGRTVHTASPKPFQIAEEPIPDFTPQARLW